MIIKGSFDPETRRPYCQGLLFIPKLKKNIKIDFIIDTGSDVTTLNPGDGRRLSLDYSKLSYTEQALGVNSEHNAASLRAIIAFVSEDGFLPIYSIQLHISPYSKECEKLPSMLGTDILHRWRMDWYPTRNILEFEVVSSDGTLDNKMFDM
jgi:hypothetical protein